MARRRTLPPPRPLSGLGRRLHPELPEAVQRICRFVNPEGGQGNITDARQLYVATFGKPGDTWKTLNKRIKLERARCLDEALHAGTETVTMPLDLALADWLDEGGGGRTRGPARDRAKETVVWHARRLQDELREQPRKRSRTGGTAEAAAERYAPGSRMTTETIQARMSHTSRRRRKTKRKPSRLAQAQAELEQQQARIAELEQQLAAERARR
jgi:hypothetical protein